MAPAEKFPSVTVKNVAELAGVSAMFAVVRAKSPIETQGVDPHEAELAVARVRPGARNQLNLDHFAVGTFETPGPVVMLWTAPPDVPSRSTKARNHTLFDRVLAHGEDNGGSLQSPTSPLALLVGRSRK
jgi:hypothetical protein